MNLHLKHQEPDSNTPNTSISSAPIENTKEESSLSEVLRFALIALVIVLPIRWFIAQPFIVSGASMEDTFHNNEYLIVDQVTYRFEEPKRGDVIIFHYPLEPSKYFIKRIIGLPGDTVNIEGNVVIIENQEYPGGIALNEPYINEMLKGANITETLGSNEYFVMGDNRDHSSDSRTWGVLERDEIVGRALLRLFPFSKASVLPGEYNTDQELLDT